MSRKDLSRTVIEGGRYYHNRFFRRASHGIERATTRAWLDRVGNDRAEADASAPEPIAHVHKMFRDKLAPAHRWLVAQVGRPWDKIYSELRMRFDSRTIAGRHVVEDHMLDWVRHHDDPTYQPRHRFALVIDRHGILRRPPTHQIDTTTWAAGRVCALTYRGWWWFRVVNEQPCWWGPTCKRPHFESNHSRYHARMLVPGGALTRSDRRTLDQLSAYERSRLVIPSPWPAR